MARLLPLALLLAVAGCDTGGSGTDPGTVCTLEFRTVGVQVVDADGVPIPDLETESVVETGATLALDGTGSDGPVGSYVVATDAHIDLLDEGGSTVRFTAQNDAVRATATFEIAGGPCHIEKRSGPTRIVAAPR